MASKATSLLLALLFGLNVLTFAMDGDFEHKCTHDLNEHPEPELLDMEENFPAEGEDRALASASSFRMWAYYGRLSSQPSTYANYIEKQLIPPILAYFSAALKVKYPVSGLFKTTASCGGSAPSILKSGVDADFVYFIDAQLDTSSNWVADSSTCSLASGSKRPLMGKTTLNRNLLKAQTTNILLHEKNMVCVMHEMTHLLGFSSSLYKYFLNSNGNTLSGHILSATLDGATSKVLNVEPLTSTLRSHFGCSSLKGAYMENSGSSATAGSHFERRQFAFEYMTSGLVYEMKVTKFTLALLEGTGWYEPNYGYAEPYSWGEGQGCNFLTKSCSASSFNEFCSGSSRGCSVTGQAGGSCQSDVRSDNCKFIHPNVNYHCENPDAENSARLPGLQTFGRGAGSKCFTGTLTSSSSSGSQTSFCFKYSCSGSGSSTTLAIHVGSKTVTCTGEGSKTVSGYAGSVHCPDPLAFCSSVGAATCPRNCMGRGTCVDGACKCNSGFKGTDCALNA